jgi:hypothetical protein
LVESAYSIFFQKRLLFNVNSRLLPFLFCGTMAIFIDVPTKKAKRMKKLLSWGLLVLAGLPFLSSCGGDDDETPKAGISFEVTEDEVTESDGTESSIHPDLTSLGEGRDIEVKIVFDRETADVAVIKYDVSGSAVLTNPSGSAVNDYTLVAGDGISDLDDDQFTVEKGVTEATIIVRLYEDFSFEYDDTDGLNETVELELQSVVSGPVQLAEQKTSYTLTVVEDDPVILLQWAVNGSMETADVNAVDMDLFVWLDGDEVNSSTYDNTAGTQELPYEGLYIPAGFPDGTYGLSYTYFSGESDDVDFVSIMFGTLNGETYSYDEEDDYLTFQGTYTTANINKYTETEIAPKIVQTMVKDGINFKDISSIEEPAEGSRVGKQEKVKIPAAVFKSLRRFELPAKTGQRR